MDDNRSVYALSVVFGIFTRYDDAAILDVGRWGWTVELPEHVEVSNEDKNTLERYGWLEQDDIPNEFYYIKA